MILSDDTIVGQKGEILPKKHLREHSGILPGDRILIEAKKGVITIRKIYSVNEALNLPTIAKGTAESIEKELEEEYIKQENVSSNE